MGALGQLLGVSGALLGDSWGLLGRFLRALGQLLDASWTPFGSQTLPQSGLDSILAPFWIDLNPIWDLFSIRFFVHDAGMAAENPSCHLLKLFFLPLQCGGTCTAHPPPPEGSAERARHKVQVPNLASKAFLNLKSLA